MDPEPPHAPLDPRWTQAGVQCHTAIEWPLPFPTRGGGVGGTAYRTQPHTATQNYTQPHSAPGPMSQQPASASPTPFRPTVGTSAHQHQHWVRARPKNQFGTYFFGRTDCEAWHMHRRGRDARGQKRRLWDSGPNLTSQNNFSHGGAIQAISSRTPGPR
jgi:hypothetical protein